MSPILGIWASANQKQYISTTAYESIATTTVGAGGSASVTFSSIPSTYTHLQIRGSFDTTPQTDINFRFNSDSGSNYAYHYLYGNGTSVASAGSASQTYGYLGYNPNVATRYGFVIDILDYTNTNKYKTARTLAGEDDNSTNGFIFLTSSLWQNTNAITSVQLLCQGTTVFDQYSSFALYGIKGA